jgi:hypothetical protein
VSVYPPYRFLDLAIAETQSWFHLREAMRDYSAEELADWATIRRQPHRHVARERALEIAAHSYSFFDGDDEALARAIPELARRY